MKTVTIIDYGVGNLASLGNAFRYLDIPHRVTEDPEVIREAEKLVLPGVGAFAAAMERLQETGLQEILLARVAENVPLLGICLGMQVLFSKSYEGGEWQGLDLIPGEVRRFEGVRKIPHMGWNNLFGIRETPLTRDLPADPYVYFVHSYYCMPEDAGHILARCRYGREFCAAVHRNNIWGVQFHPEKSQEVGLRILRNFAERI